jgi:peptidoglycan lytic transglycosylase
MPTTCTSDASQPEEFDSRFSVIALKSCCRLVATVALSAALAFSGCDRRSPQAKKEKPKQPVDAQSSPAKKDNWKESHSREGYAVWYAVPDGSLPRRRAKKGELIASHNHLRFGTLVRVTHLGNGKSVVVRITDRGITNKAASIDLCKEAAEKLEMISEGMARVRMEELPNDTETDAGPDSRATATHP